MLLLKWNWLAMSVDEVATHGEQQGLADDEEQLLESLGAELEKCCEQLDLTALHDAAELLRRESNTVKFSRNVVEAQQRSKFMRQLSSIVTDACSKLDAKMTVWLSHCFPRVTSLPHSSHNHALRHSGARTNLKVWGERVAQSAGFFFVVTSTFVGSVSTTSRWALFAVLLLTVSPVPNH